MSQPLLQRVVAPEAEPIDLIHSGELEGRGGWSSGLPEKLPRKNAKGERIFHYCILDREYFPDEEVNERYKEAKERGVNLHIWSRKEIENYLLVPTAISRFITENAADDVTPPDSNDVAMEIEYIIEAMRDSPITDGFAKNLLDRDKAGGVTKANREARRLVSERWKSAESRCVVAPGKKVMSRLSDWASNEFGVSFGTGTIAQALRASEIDREIGEVLKAIELRRGFAPPE